MDGNEDEEELVDEGVDVVEDEDNDDIGNNDDNKDWGNDGKHNYAETRTMAAMAELHLCVTLVFHVQCQCTIQAWRLVTF